MLFYRVKKTDKVESGRVMQIYQWASSLGTRIQIASQFARLERYESRDLIIVAGPFRHYSMPLKKGGELGYPVAYEREVSAN